MGSTTAFQCDGPGCGRLTTREPNTRFPATWPRLTLHANGAAVSGSFHDTACAQAWLAQHLDIAAAPAPLAAAAE